MKTLKLTPTALSVLETDVLDYVPGESLAIGHAPDDGYDAIRNAFRDGGLDVWSENAEALGRALNDLSNHCDDLVEHKHVEGDEKKIYRAASKTFATLSSKAWRA